LRLFAKGTPFQIQVWRALMRIPAGAATSYGDLAAELGRPGASRAVGRACGANRIGVLIPCHRVIRETGALGGYQWGLERKQAVLAWESTRRLRGEAMRLAG
jgi:AraC family transcriptional regulator of adaptative response/methylated-DNA-[protein]-cysteine methyltransferase